MGRDTDGTEWRTVRYFVDVEVIADNEEDALYYADCALGNNIGVHIPEVGTGKVID